MQWLTAEISDPALHLALDEALLLELDEGTLADGALRIWELEQIVVILGRSSRYAEEVDTNACKSDNVPIYRRSSGGAAVVAGPGCLMYSLHLQRTPGSESFAIDEVHRQVLGPLRSEFAKRVNGVHHCGVSDLAIEDRKFSGNSLRVRRESVLYHGTILYEFPIEIVSRYLRMPPRQPDYRRRRRHGDFLTALPLGRDEIVAILGDAWRAIRRTNDWPRERVEVLAKERYRNPRWTFQR